jgi:hypothetical protein
VRYLDGGSGITPYLIEVILGSSTPPYTCADLDAGIPASVVVHGGLALYVAQSPTLLPGTFAITDPDTFKSTDVPSVGFATIELFGPTSPPTNDETETESSLSGSVTLTKVGDEWAGSFTAMMIDGASVSSTLSGTFDTSNICETEP